MRHTYAKIRHRGRLKRHARIRANVAGDRHMPRLSIFRSYRYIWAQVIDDTAGKTLASASDREVKTGTKATKREKARETGALLAKRSLEAGIKKVRFDRGGFRYHGRIKEFADAARKAGLEF